MFTDRKGLCHLPQSRAIAQNCERSFTSCERSQFALMETHNQAQKCAAVT